LAEFTRMAGDLCAKHEVTLVIEHLNRRETNTLNTLAEALSLCERAGSPGVAVLVDSYHFGLEQEIDEAVLELGDSLAHVHLAEPVDRIQPGGHGADADQAFDFANFFALLHKIGYDQRLSLECSWKPSFEAAVAGCVQWVRQAWEASAGCEQ
jgi:sugar phosphate isomerase/epimerase